MGFAEPSVYQIVAVLSVCHHGDQNNEAMFRLLYIVQKGQK